MKNRCFIFLCIFLLGNFCVQSQSSGRRDNPAVLNSILTDRYGFDYFNRTSYEERSSRYELSKKHFFEAVKLYNNNVLIAAISELERAIQQCPHGVYYFHYGVLLMDIHEYTNAEKAFNKALQFMEFWDPFYEPFDRGESHVYTFDQNGAPTEKYFTYYNLACVHSQMHNINTSFNYLKDALEHGFSQIDQIFRDPYLRNVLNYYRNAANILQEIYNAGSANPFLGRSFVYGRENEQYIYVFLDNKNIYSRSVKIFENVRYGTYEIKNYQLIINYDRETDNEGEKNIKMREIFNTKEMSKLWNEENNP